MQNNLHEQIFGFSSTGFRRWPEDLDDAIFEDLVVDYSVQNSDSDGDESAATTCVIRSEVSTGVGSMESEGDDSTSD